MNFRLVLILSLAILAIADDAKPLKRHNKLKNKKLGEWKEAKDVYTTVNEKNQAQFGLPIGTKLKVDRKTKLYKPPKLSANFTADDRIMLTWNNDLTKKTYCKVGPGNLTSDTITYDFYWHRWCANSDGENLCCNNYNCDCNVFGNNCACVLNGL